VRSAVAFPDLSALPAAAAAFEPVLNSLIVDTAAFFGAASVRLTTVALEERPYSFVARMGVSREGETDPFTYLFVKAVKVQPGDGERDRMRHRVEHEFEVTRRVYGSMNRQADVGVVRPVACYPQHLVIATEQVVGVTLLDHMTARASWFNRQDGGSELAMTMAKTGRWLREFQSFDAGSGAVTLEWFRDYVDIRLRRLVDRSGGRFREPDRQRTLGYIDAQWPQVSPDHLRDVAIHADLALSNVLVAGHRIVVLDFAMAKRGGPLHDLSRLYVQIEMLEMKPYLRRAVLRQAQAALLAGFDPSLTRESAAMRLYTLLHRINNYGSLILKPSSFPTSWYNGLAARQHRRWLDSELTSATTPLTAIGP
jgi:hypothetical protein